VHRVSVCNVHKLGRTESVAAMGEVTINSVYFIFTLSVLRKSIASSITNSLARVI
jgi:hypothetical protein